MKNIAKEKKVVRKKSLGRVELLEYLEFSLLRGELRAHRSLSKYLSRMITMGQLIAETARRSGSLGL